MVQTVGNVGIFHSQQFVPDLAKLSFAGMITHYMPAGQAPLFGLTSMLPSSTATNVEHGYWSKAAIFPAFNLISPIAAGDTTFNVETTKFLLPGQLHRLEQTGEIVIINSIVSGTQITVGRAIGQVPAAAVTLAQITDAYQVGNAHEEASLRPQAQNLQPVQITNLTQIFRNAWAVSGSAAAIQRIVGESTISSNKQDCAALHAGDIEKALFFGQKSQSWRNGLPMRTMDGLLSVVGNISYYPSSYSVPNVYPAGLTTNYTQLETMLDPVFNQATDPKVSNERVLFVGGKARIVLNNIGRKSGQYQIVDGQTSWGLQFSTFKISRGTFRIIEHPLFNTNEHWSRMAVAVDLSTFGMAYLGNRKTQESSYNTDGAKVDDGIDAMGGDLLTEVTTEIRNPPANAFITGLTGAGDDV